MRNLWEDDHLHHQFQLVERESDVVLKDSIEIHTVELAKYNGGASEVHVANILEQWAYWIKKRRRTYGRRATRFTSRVGVSSSDG